MGAFLLKILSLIRQTVALVASALPGKMAKSPHSLFTKLII